MLSVGPGARRFSPSQDIHVKKYVPHQVGNVHYRQHVPTGAQSLNGRADGGLLWQDRILAWSLRALSIITSRLLVGLSAESWGLLGGQLGRKSAYNQDRRSARVRAGDHRYGS